MITERDPGLKLGNAAGAQVEAGRLRTVQAGLLAFYFTLFIFLRMPKSWCGETHSVSAQPVNDWFLCKFGPLFCLFQVMKEKKKQNCIKIYSSVHFTNFNAPSIQFMRFLGKVYEKYSKTDCKIFSGLIFGPAVDFFFNTIKV